MKAVIFGGSGFIGSHLTESLLSRGAEVVIADLQPPARLPQHTTYEQCDVRQEIGLNVGGPVDAIYNLAAKHRTPGHKPHEYYETNVLGAQNVTDWAAATGGQYICFASSISVYGVGEKPIDESSPLKPNSDYGRSKAIAERIHHNWRRAGSGRRLVIVRPAVVFGSGERGNFTRLANALARRRFFYPGRRDTIKACGYVGELVRAITFIEGSDTDSTTFNFCYPRKYTIEAICDAFSVVAGYASPRTLPRAAVQFATAGLRMLNRDHGGRLSAARVEKLTNSTNVIPAELIRRGYEWDTDLLGGIQAWQQSLTGRYFA